MIHWEYGVWALDSLSPMLCYVKPGNWFLGREQELDEYHE